MSASINIRQPRVHELARTRQIADDIMRQVYRDILEGRSLVPAALEPWADAWIALFDDEIIGVGRSQDDLVSDLWLLPQGRGHGLGRRLLTRLEIEIKKRGFTRAKLRVVEENHAARAFYRARGWHDGSRFKHEKLGFPMRNMYKDLNTSAGEYA